MYKRKITVIIGAVILLAGIVLFLAFGKGNIATELRNGISQSIDEDFKIKESLGQIFFADSKEEGVTVSSNITVTSLTLPANGEYIFCEELGEYKMKIYANKFSNVVACQDGTIENIENNKISLRLNDGKLVKYSGVGSLVKKDELVSQGDTVGYAVDTVEVSIYENCTCLNVQEYFYK